jgi:hypothetical protein
VTLRSSAAAATVTAAAPPHSAVADAPLELSRVLSDQKWHVTTALQLERSLLLHDAL